MKRSATDYERIRCDVRLFNPDILALQEVDGEAALSRVVDSDVYDVHVSDRPRGGLNGQQNTGFAFKRGLMVTKQADFTALDTSGNGSLRYGTRIDLTHNRHTIQLMSVPLKSGCVDNTSSDPEDCPKLLAQIPVLEGWIDHAAHGPHAFIILGDFNRRFTLPHDMVWTDLDDGEPANTDLTAVERTGDRSHRRGRMGLPPVVRRSSRLVDNSAAQAALAVGHRRETGSSALETTGPCLRTVREMVHHLDHGMVGCHGLAADGTIFWANCADDEPIGDTHKKYGGPCNHQFHANLSVLHDMLERLSAGERLDNDRAHLHHTNGS